MLKSLNFKGMLSFLVPKKIKWVSGRAGDVSGVSDAVSAEQGEFTFAMSNYIRHEAKKIMEKDGFSGREFHIVKVDGTSQLPKGLEDGEFCIVVEVSPVELKKNDVIVLRLDDERSELSKRFKFRALTEYDPSKNLLLTYRYDPEGEKVVSRPHNADFLVGKVHARVQFH